MPSETVANDMDFAGRTVLVVGGSSGIGNGIAQAFRKRGATVHVWGTRPDTQDYAAEAGSDLSGLCYTQVDVADRASLDACRPSFDHLDTVVLSQGTVAYRAGEFERAGWDRVLAVNLSSVMDCAIKFQNALARANGSLIILSSIGGLRATPTNPAYSASKAGAISLVQALAQAWAPDGIRVNGIAPGPVDTKLVKTTTENPRRRAALEERIPLGRIGKPEDIAGAALFLASPLASFMTGQTIVVDGGISLT